MIDLEVGVVLSRWCHPQKEEYCYEMKDAVNDCVNQKHHFLLDVISLDEWSIRIDEEIEQVKDVELVREGAVVNYLHAEVESCN